jgi:hypothetical protein
MIKVAHVNLREVDVDVVRPLRLFKILSVRWQHISIRSREEVNSIVNGNEPIATGLTGSGVLLLAVAFEDELFRVLLFPRVLSRRRNGNDKAAHGASVVGGET